MLLVGGLVGVEVNLLDVRPVARLARPSMGVGVAGSFVDLPTLFEQGLILA